MQTIAIVDAYANPYAQSDLNMYRSTFGLPAITLQQVSTACRPRTQSVSTDNHCLHLRDLKNTLERSKLAKPVEARPHTFPSNVPVCSM